MKDNNKNKFTFKFGTTEIVILICIIILSLFLNKIVVSMNGYYYLDLPKNSSQDRIIIKEFKDKKVLLFKYTNEHVTYNFFDENGTLISHGRINNLYYNTTLSYHKKDSNLSFRFKDFYTIKQSKYLENNWSKK